MNRIESPFRPAPVAACAIAPDGEVFPVYLRRVSPRGAMAQAAELAERNVAGVFVLVGGAAAAKGLPRWRMPARA